jgi:O-antigen/teichoic acid export membrane protein
MLFTYILYVKQKGPKLKVDKKRIKPLLKQSYHFILSGLMIAIYAQTDKVMIGKMLTDMSAVGLYSVATTITSLWSFIPAAIITSFRPVIIEAKLVSYDKYIKRLKQLYSLILWINIAYALGVTIFADIIIKLLYGEAYMGAKIPLLFAVWSGGFSYIGVARDIWFVSEGLQGYSTRISLFGCLTNVVLNLILIPQFGIVGAAIATTITQIFTGFVSTLLFKKTRNNSKYILQALFLKF